MPMGKNRKLLGHDPAFHDSPDNRLRDPGVLLIVLALMGAIALVLFSFVYPEVAKAGVSRDQINENPWQTTSGQLFFKKNDTSFRAAALLKTEVEINVIGVIAKAHVRQTFSNNGANWLEGIYAFPLPEDAAVTSLHMEIGDRRLEGRVQERQAARKTYEKARTEGSKTSLLEQQRPNIFTVSVANIGPGEKVIIDLEYQNTVTYENGTFSLRFPTVIGPRYTPAEESEILLADNGHSFGYSTSAGTEVPDADRRASSPVSPEEDPVNPISITVNLDTGLVLAAIESPTHGINVEPHDNDSQTVLLANGWAASTRDFVLEWRPESSAGPQVAVFSEDQGEATYLMLLLVPSVEDVLQQEMAREVIFVLDVSGSMAGSSIAQAKEAMRLAVDRLAAWDSFDIITFNNQSRRFFGGARKATPLAKQKALQFIDGLSAGGGTEMRDALLLALDEGQDRPQTNRLRQVVFLTDGCVGNEKELFRTIRARIGESRLFTVGIGSAPNSYFMKNSARAGRGTYTCIGKVEEVQARMEALFVKLESPSLTDLAIHLPDGAPYEGFPDPLPDLYLGEPVAAVLKTDRLPERVSLTGRFAGRKWQMEVRPRLAAFQKGIGVLWARNKIEHLMESLLAGVQSETEVRRQVLDTALRHHLVSRYTSLVVADVTPTRTQEEGLATERLQTNLPDGWQYAAISAVPRTGTIAGLCNVLGALSLLLSCLIYMLLRRLRQKEVAR